MNELSLKSVVEESSRELWKGLAILGSYLGAFWLASFSVDWFIFQMLIYIGLFFVTTWLLYRPEVKELAAVAKRFRGQ